MGTADEASKSALSSSSFSRKTCFSPALECLRASPSVHLGELEGDPTPDVVAGEWHLSALSPLPQGRRLQTEKLSSIVQGDIGFRLGGLVVVRGHGSCSAVDAASRRLMSRGLAPAPSPLGFLQKLREGVRGEARFDIDDFGLSDFWAEISTPPERLGVALSGGLGGG